MNTIVGESIQSIEKSLVQPFSVSKSTNAFCLLRGMGRETWE